jgi:hypothetical protein
MNSNQCKVTETYVFDTMCYLTWAKAVGAWHLSRTPSSAEVKERVTPYLDCTYGPSRPVLRWTLLFTTYVVPGSLTRM